jgi:hypothetical protein
MLALTDSELACSRSPPPRSHRRNADDGSSRLPTARRRSSTAAERPPRRALPSAFALTAVPGKSRLDRSARVSAVNPFANIGASVQPSRSDGSRFGLVRGPHVRRTATSRHARRRWQRSRKVGGGVVLRSGSPLLFSNRPFRVKRFQTIHDCGVNVARGLALLSGLGTKALPSWVSKTRWNNLSGDLAVNVTAGSSGRTNSPHPSSREGHHSTARWSSSVLLLD